MSCISLPLSSIEFFFECILVYVLSVLSSSITGPELTNSKRKLIEDVVIFQPQLHAGILVNCIHYRYES